MTMNNELKEQSVNAHFNVLPMPFSAIKGGNKVSQSCGRRAMTLIELLIVVTILVMLLAVSVPMLKPMLQSRRTQNAAEVVASTLQRARAQALAEKRAVGVKFVPYQTAPATAVQLRIYKEAEQSVINTPENRVVVDNGTIVAVKYKDGKYTTEGAVLPAEFRAGGAVQFNRQGRSYVMEANAALQKPFDTLTLPETLDMSNITDALEYKISPPLSAALTPQIVMPKETVADLYFSGGRGTDAEVGASGSGQFPLQFSGINDIKTDPQAGVTILFSPSGNVQKILFNDVVNQTLPNEMIYFCVGEWGRQTDKITGKTFAEDGMSNLESPATFWVSLHPKTGEVRISENAPVIGTNPLTAKIQQARKYATEHYVNIGGN